MNHGQEEHGTPGTERRGHTTPRRRDLEADLARMRHVAHFCHQEAGRVKDPAFQAIVGLMHDYIGIQTDALGRPGGNDPGKGTTPAMAFRVQQIGERLQLIFGGCLTVEVGPLP